MTGTRRVRLVLPAVDQFARVARVAAAVLARDHGFGVREIDELQSALAGALRVVLDAAATGSTVELAYEVAGGELGIEIRLAEPDGSPAGMPRELRRSRAAQPV